MTALIHLFSLIGYCYARKNPVTRTNRKTQNYFYFLRLTLSPLQLPLIPTIPTSKSSPSVRKCSYRLYIRIHTGNDHFCTVHRGKLIWLVTSKPAKPSMAVGLTCILFSAPEGRSARCFREHSLLQEASPVLPEVFSPPVIYTLLQHVIYVLLWP